MWEKIFVLITFAGDLLVIIGMTAFICAMLFIHNKRQSQFEQEELRVRIEVQEATVEQISKELHDNVGHELTLAKLQIKNVALEVSGDAEEKLSCVLDLLTRSLIMIRDISKSLSLDLIS